MTSLVLNNWALVLQAQDISLHVKTVILADQKQFLSPTESTQ